MGRSVSKTFTIAPVPTVAFTIPTPVSDPILVSPIFIKNNEALASNITTLANVQSGASDARQPLIIDTALSNSSLKSRLTYVHSDGRRTQFPSTETTTIVDTIGLTRLSNTRFSIDFDNYDDTAQRNTVESAILELGIEDFTITTVNRTIRIFKAPTNNINADGAGNGIASQINLTSGIETIFIGDGVNTLSESGPTKTLGLTLRNAYPDPLKYSIAIADPRPTVTTPITTLCTSTIAAASDNGTVTTTTVTDPNTTTCDINLNSIFTNPNFDEGAISTILPQDLLAVAVLETPDRSNTYYQISLPIDIARLNQTPMITTTLSLSGNEQSYTIFVSDPDDISTTKTITGCPDPGDGTPDCTTDFRVEWYFKPSIDSSSETLITNDSSFVKYSILPGNETNCTTANDAPCQFRFTDLNLRNLFGSEYPPAPKEPVIYAKLIKTSTNEVLSRHDTIGATPVAKLQSGNRANDTFVLYPEPYIYVALPNADGTFDSNSNPITITNNPTGDPPEVYPNALNQNGSGSIGVIDYNKNERVLLRIALRNGDVDTLIGNVNASPISADTNITLRGNLDSGTDISAQGSNGINFPKFGYSWKRTIC